MSDDGVDLIIEEIQCKRIGKSKEKTRKFKVNKNIDSKNKSNNINLKQRKFRPNVILKNKKRFGVDKKYLRFSDIDLINELDS